MELVPIDVAMKHTGHRTQSAFRAYVWKLNQVLPVDSRVVRCRGLIDMVSLEKAITVYSREYRAVNRQQ